MAERLELERALTAREVAELLNLHVNTVKREHARDRLHGFRVGTRGDLRFWPEDVRAYMALPG